MKTAVYSHPLFFAHDTGLTHPECADRLRFIARALEGKDVERHTAPAATHEQLLRVHEQRLIDFIESFGEGALDADTLTSEQSYAAALHAAGSVCAAVDAVMNNEIKNAFCAVRPPGHHAEPDTAMGFCLFNNIAVGARHAQVLHGLRVAVLDFDVHHGNGTQAAAWDDANFFFASSHQWPYYPGSGGANERGAHNNILNVPLAAGCDSTHFRAAWAEKILPACAAFAPEFIFISAGFDAHADDPLGGLALTTADFGWVTHEIATLAQRVCGGRLVSALEGGYNLAALADSAAIHVDALIQA